MNTFIGRLLNRFSKDIETIDSSLASSLQSVNSTLAAFLFSLLTVTLISPALLLAVIVIIYIYYWLGVMYLSTGRDLRRMESNNRSPVISGFSELIDGIVTVRAFSAERRFLNDVFKKIDNALVVCPSSSMQCVPDISDSHTTFSG
jgi:ABC-type multidrug transport system fused ATPase/permease subunit